MPKRKTETTVTTPVKSGGLATTPAAVAEASRQTGMALIVADAASIRASFPKLARKNLPPMVKPGDVPMGGAVSGIIMDNVRSPVSTVDGRLLWLRHESGTEYLFPATGVIRAALCPGVAGDAETKKALDGYKGFQFVAVRTPDKVSGKYKKQMFMFEVFTSDKPVDKTA